MTDEHPVTPDAQDITEEYAHALMDLDTFQGILGIQFKDSAILHQALTHRSYGNEHSNPVENNERLEFLGDAILDFITADMLFHQFPDMAEGEMTRLRAALVRTEALAKLGAECRIGEALMMGKGEANSGGRTRETNLCRAFEAVIGAIYLDRGLDVVKEFIIPRLTQMQGDVMDEAINKDSRSQFQEWAQAIHNITPEFRVIDTVGPEHEKEFIVGAYLGTQKVTEGRGRSKRAAAQDAALNALTLLMKDELNFPVKRESSS